MSAEIKDQPVLALAFLGNGEQLELLRTRNTNRLPAYAVKIPARGFVVFFDELPKAVQFIKLYERNGA